MEKILTTKVHNKKLDGDIRKHLKMEWFKNYVIVMPYVAHNRDDFPKMPNWNDECRKWLIQRLGFRHADLDIGIVFDHSNGFCISDPDHPENKKLQEIIDVGMAHLATLPSRWNYSPRKDMIPHTYRGSRSALII